MPSQTLKWYVRSKIIVIYTRCTSHDRSLDSAVDVATRLVAGLRRVRIPLVNGKGTTIPVQVWTSPEGSRRYRLSDFQIVGT